MTLNASTVGRLYNSKFEDAMWCLDGAETDREREIVILLGKHYGGSGWGGAEELDEVGMFLLQELFPGQDLDKDSTWTGREEIVGLQNFEVTWTYKQIVQAANGRQCLESLSDGLPEEVEDGERRIYPV